MACSGRSSSSSSADGSRECQTVVELDGWRSFTNALLVSLCQPPAASPPSERLANVCSTGWSSGEKTEELADRGGGGENAPEEEVGEDGSDGCVNARKPEEDGVAGAGAAVLGVPGTDAGTGGGVVGRVRTASSVGSALGVLAASSETGAVTSRKPDVDGGIGLGAASSSMFADAISSGSVAMKGWARVGVEGVDASCSGVGGTGSAASTDGEWSVW